MGIIKDIRWHYGQIGNLYFIRKISYMSEMNDTTCMSGLSP